MTFNRGFVCCPTGSAFVSIGIHGQEPYLLCSQRNAERLVGREFVGHMIFWRWQDDGAVSGQKPIYTFNFEILTFCFTKCPQFDGVDVAA